MVKNFTGVSNNFTLDDFKDLLDHNKITHAEAERMKSKRSGRDLPFIKIKCDNVKQAEALISGGLVCQKTGIIFKARKLGQHPRYNSVSSARVLSTRHQIIPKNRSVLCVVQLIRTKTVHTKKEVQNVIIVGDLMSPTTEAVLLTRIKPSDKM